MNERIITQFISEAKEALVEMAEGAMTYPSSDPFEHGISCGRHQGIRMALDIMDSILKGDREVDSKQ